LPDDLRLAFLEKLAAAKFDRSNRAGFGPTPSRQIFLTMKDGTQEVISFWGGSTLEFTPRSVDPEAHFLLQSTALGEFLREHAPVSTSQ
jgi:hypothetical protein